MSTQPCFSNLLEEKSTCIHGRKPILQKDLTLGHGRGDMDSPHTDERIKLARHRMAAPGPDKVPHTKPSWPQTQGIGGVRQWGGHPEN